MKWLRVVLAVGYPFLIFVGLQFLEARWIALGVATWLLLRWVTSWRSPSKEDVLRLLVPAVLVATALGTTIIWNDEQALLFLPVVVNLALLLAFARTLWSGPPLIESFARMQVPELPPDEVRYCRSVTIVWCAFFIGNGSICASLALFGSAWVWTLYTGFVSYLLIGLLFAVEFLVRSWRFGRYAGTPMEPIFRRIFRPPPDEGSSRGV
ncbi:MAG: hypothetical protein GY723_15435 [bacterium]|nr:hypothetical protein [bacterium]